MYFFEDRKVYGLDHISRIGKQQIEKLIVRSECTSIVSSLTTKVVCFEVEENLKSKDRTTHLFFLPFFFLFFFLFFLLFILPKTITKTRVRSKRNNMIK